MSDYLDPNNEELLKDFFAEAEQQVEQLESNILVIENDPTNHEAIDEIFRAAHTLKGGSATVEMMELSHFTHKVEDVLDEIRSDRLSVNEDVVDLLLSSIDVIKAMLEARQNGSVYEENIDDIVNKLHSYIPEKDDKKSKKSPQKVEQPKPVEVAPVAQAVPSGLQIPPLTESEYVELKQTCEPNQKLWCVAVKFDENNPMNTVGGMQVFAALKSIGNVLKTVPDFDALYEDEFYEFVYYYVASSADASAIEDAAFLSDVTLITDAHLISDTNYSATEKNVSIQNTQQVQNVEEQKSETQFSENQNALLQDILNDNILKPESKKSETPKVEEPKTEVKKTEPKKENTTTHAVQQGSILRVDSRRIDNLLNLVSEAVITKAAFNQLAIQTNSELTNFHNLEAQFREFLHNLFDELPQYFEQIKEGASSSEIKNAITQKYGNLSNIFTGFDSELKTIARKLRSNTQNLGTITGELQEGVMKIRMVPINQIFSRFPRVVRDLQKDLNKKINLVIEGEDTELDKSVVEDLLDPIMHCVRNSVDHGIEAPEVRKANGKSETGTVLLKASNEGNMIVIEVKDDGAGIDVEKVREKAIKKGLIHPDKVITDQDAYQLIMQPGFSTSDKITNISGRGVGLDVVKTMINNLKGSISVQSAKGKGTSFIIKLPLTLAIIQGLLVRVADQIYSIPIANVIESQRIDYTEISHIDNYEIMTVRNEVISVLRLSRLFGLPEETASDGSCYIVIVGTQEKKIGVMVDALIGEEDVVIKPLKDKFTSSPGIAGASILGDGSVSLIIDVSQLVDLGIQQETLAKQQEMSVQI